MKTTVVNGDFHFQLIRVKLLFLQKKKPENSFYEDICLYSKRLPLVESITHVGVVLNFKFCSLERTGIACKKLKSGTMALIRSGAHPKTLNPLTVAKVIKCKVFSSALYECKLWHLSKTELIKLEITQQFIAKSIQGLNMRTRTDMVNSLI